MRNTFTLLLIGIAQILLGWQSGVRGGVWLWSGAVFVAVAVAYAKRWPGLFGKREDGRLPVWRMAILLPYLLFTWIVWYFETRWSREAACHEVGPGLWLGRRPASKDIPDGVSHIIDLTAEFGESRRVREGRNYYALPTLDATVPDRAATERIVNAVAQNGEACYIHCALGHGRSALVAAIVMVARQYANDVEDAMNRIQTIRPGVNLNAEQWKWLREWQSP